MTVVWRARQPLPAAVAGRNRREARTPDAAAAAVVTPCPFFAAGRSLIRRCALARVTA